MTNFFRTISVFHENPFVNPFIASIRHSGWALRKLFNLFPCEVNFGDRIIYVATRAAANGSVTLANAMGYYDPNNMLFIEDVFRSGIYDTFFDIGANYGFYSLIVAGRTKTTRVHAFEPHPVTFARLRENIQINHQSDNVICNQFALGEENGILAFRDLPGDPENRVIDDRSGKIQQLVEVMVCRGDDYCRQMNLLPPQILKIDVEGYENHVLAGFASILDAVQLIFVECWDLEKTVELLRDGAGFLRAL